MIKTNPPVIHRQDYQPPNYWISQVNLSFNLEPEHTEVHSQLHLQRNPSNPSETLHLHGENLQLKAVHLNGKTLDETAYQYSDNGLILFNLPATALLETWVEINPQANSELSGLYQSNGNFCTQCEAEGFRRITYFLDRPDVMSAFNVRIEADKTAYPVLLSNGNRIAHGESEANRHWVQWQDPHLKPCYLFALVAGDLRCQRGEFITCSGRKVALEIWVEPQNIDYCEHALISLQKAMRWDEDVYGLEYDLDTYMIVAVNDFNMGAMENKGLNLFNSKYVLAQPQTATDEDHANIESVVAHEYFHNWTGNRVTCRDWFQLTLKEGLTVFRDQQFSATMESATVQRIQNVRLLRNSQFLEDDSPMQHPIRPESYIKIKNFYTSTVYDKGAEVVRMLHTLLGADGFRRGMAVYFQRHDGQAVTCDDFLAAMADANQRDLSQFARWYSQAGTPVIDVTEDFDFSTKTYRLTLSQSCAVASWQPLHIPVKMGFIATDGAALPPFDRVLELTEARQTFEFKEFNEKPVVSLFRDFSAPVKCRQARTHAQLAFVMAHDNDPFNRWDAGQSLAQQVILELIQAILDGKTLILDPLFAASFGAILRDERLDGAIKALLLTLPDENTVAQHMAIVEPDALHSAHQFVQRRLGEAHDEWLADTYHAQQSGAYQATPQAIQQRALKNCCLGYISANPANHSQLALLQFKQADNMTDQYAALACLVNHGGELAAQALQAFYQQWESEPLVLDKWFNVQATARHSHALEQVMELCEHTDFTLHVPNRVYALLVAFSRKTAAFHRPDGRGYQFIADKVLALDGINPQVAARLASAFNQWRRFDPVRQQLMQTQLQRLLATTTLSVDVYEIVSKNLS